MIAPSTTPKMETTTENSTITTATEQPKIENLFNFSRFPSGWKLVALCVYFPIGVILAVLRLFIGLHVLVLSIILRQFGVGRCVLRFMSIILGFVVSEKGEQRSSRVIVANHVSPFDYFVITLIRSCVMPSSWDAPEIFQRIFGIRNLGLRNGRDTLIKNAKTYCAGENASTQPLVTFPEGTMTKGTSGFLKFNTWPFSLDLPVQPLVIRCWRPAFTDVALTTVGSGFLADLFWAICVPFTMFELTWLPEMRMDEGETADTFARKVEKSLAEAAGVRTTNFTSHDAFEFAKRHLIERVARTNENRGHAAPHRYEQLAARVKEIVPQVPTGVIIAELERNNGVMDTVVSNILEGRVSFTPESPQTVAASRSVQKPPPKVSATDPSTWHDLYESRKREMLETHRRKYLEKKAAHKNAIQSSLAAASPSNS